MVIYILYSCYMNRSITPIEQKFHTTFVVLLFNIFEPTFTRSLFFHYKIPMNTVQLIVFKVLMFYENIGLLPSVDSSEISTGNDDPNEGTTLLLVSIYISNKLVYTEVVNE